MKQFLGVILVLIFLLFVRPADAMFYNPAADGTIFDFDTNDGVLNFVNVYHYPQVMHFQCNIATTEDRAFWEFDLSSVNQTIKSVIFHNDVAAANGNYPFSLNLYRYQGDGTIGFNDYDSGVFLVNT